MVPLKFASALGLVYAMAGVLYAAAMAANKLTNGRVFQTAGSGEALGEFVIRDYVRRRAS